MILTESNNPERSIYSPMRIGGLELSNRLVMAPVAIHLAPITGEISEDTIRYFLERARGGVGLILMAGTGWARVDAAHPSIPYEQVSFYKEERTEGHKRLVESLKRTEVKLGVQIHHRGRQAPRHPFDCVPVAPSSIPWSPRAEVPQALSISEIDSLIERYGKIAEQAKRIGFDLVEIHAAHGYLVSNFLSPDSNQRHDQYGGDLQGRARFLIDIVKNVRIAVGSNYPISIRMNGSDFKKGGLTLEESKKIAHLLEGAGVDLINVSGGVNGSFPLTISPYYVQKGYFVHLSEEIKKEVNIPVMVAGRIHEIPFAEKVVKEGKADLIAMGRALVADPYLPLKSFEGKEMDIRKCLSCNHCIDTFSYGAGEMTCVVNPSLGREKEIELMPAKRRKVIWVIGAGLAGMEAAWRASSRGHSVTLFDKESSPGGMWILASTPPEKQHFYSFIDYLLNRIKRSGVTAFFNKSISAEGILKAKPDAVIIATGAQPKEGFLSSLKEKERTSAWDILKGKIPDGMKCLVIGGGAVGLEVAHLLAVKGKEVTVVEMRDKFGIDMGDTLRWNLMRILRNYGVKMVPSVEVRYADEDYLHVTEKGGQHKWKKFDMHVVAIGLQATDVLRPGLTDFKGEIYIIGDAKEPRKGVDAIREGAEIGNTI